MDLRKEIRKVISEYLLLTENCDYLQFMNLQYNDSIIEELLKKYKKPNINEGLIQFVSPQKALQILNRIVGEKNITLLKERGVLFVNITDVDDLGKLKSTIQNIGYFISEIIFMEKGGEKYETIKYTESSMHNCFKNKNNYKKLIIQVNGKYINQVEIPEYLYHITIQMNLPKISKIGLVPKSKSKKVYHPERIYLTSNFEDASLLKDKFQEYYQSSMVILKISTKYLKDFKLYNDPDYSNCGVFTLDNIPPKNIVDIINI